ncbi:hypothetical protein DH2020_040285 [Rehmannia glutinosa]|uniref:Myb-like domain-containing protein n=1 Tax=Rehmannia glutinosa TaxID=99300 RepID=A0ABR0UUL0_REHGL
MDHGHQWSIDTGGGGGDRFPQWSIQETRDFLMVRAELDPAFMETKRNKLLWEMVSTRMKDMGYNRSPDQCKCKWKNLGCETMESEGMRQQFPYYNEMQTIFTSRMQRMLWLEAEGGGAATATTSKKKAAAQFSSSDDEEIEHENDDVGSSKKKRKLKGNISNNIIDGLKEIMEDFMRQQMEMEMQWLRAYEEREERRRVKEMEWRQKMEVLENERIMMERRWREKNKGRLGKKVGLRKGKHLL